MRLLSASLIVLITIVRIDAQQNPTPHSQASPGLQVGGATTGDVQQKVNELNTTIAALKSQLDQRVPTADLEKVQKQLSDANELLRKKLDGVVAGQADLLEQIQQKANI